MNLFGVMESSGSAMQAERIRAEVVATNMANAETTRTQSGEPYRRQMVVFMAGNGDTNTAADSLPIQTRLPTNWTFGNQDSSSGVRIAGVFEDTGEPMKRFDPGHPDAGADGYVSYPNINPLTEMVDLMGATRAYGLNGSAVQAEKNMIGSALEIAKA